MSIALDRVGVAGLGTIGLPTAQHIAAVYPVIGYDIRADAVARAQRRIPRNFTGTTDHRALADADACVVCVSTGLQADGTPDVAAVRDVFAKLAALNPALLVSVESTVPVGTCRRLAAEFGLHRVANCPHRYWSEDPERHGVVQPRILGALNPASLAAAAAFYDQLGIPVLRASSIEVAETTKIVEQSHRFVEISFVEELKLICEKLQLPFDEVRAACNTKWNVALLEAREGIGGTCLPKDIRYLLHSGGINHLLTGALDADAAYVTQRRAQRTREPE